MQNTVQKQFKDTECGMFCLYFLIEGEGERTSPVQDKNAFAVGVHKALRHEGNIVEDAEALGSARLGVVPRGAHHREAVRHGPRREGLPKRLNGRHGLKG